MKKKIIISFKMYQSCRGLYYDYKNVNYIL